MHQPRKRFGQHFLHDQHVIKKIVNAVMPSMDDNLVEIGPGLGALTTHILPLVEKLTVVELDRDVIPILLANCAAVSTNELVIHQVDALRFDFRQLFSNNKKLRLIGNLPYNISTPLLFHLLKNADIIQDMHFMLQKEVVDRMAAKPKQASYGRLSVMLQYHCQVQTLFTVKPGAFRPPPKVDSAIVRLIPHNNLLFPAIDYELFSEIVRHAFNQRRKTLRNCLKTLVSAEQLEQVNIDPQQRAEELSVEDYVRISNHVAADQMLFPNLFNGH